MSKFLIIGNLGYVGTFLSFFIKKSLSGTTIYGVDNGYFVGNLINPYYSNISSIDYQYIADIRLFSDPNVFKNIDSVIYLAAISNDPMGNKFEEATFDINVESAINCALQAKLNGVKNFIYASSCSIYGSEGIDGLGKIESSPLDPLTAYAKSKIKAEENLQLLANNDFKIKCLRFATACGASPRIRLDLVLNDFVASSLLNKKIDILSDGKPLRPIIDVEDMSKAIVWAATTNTPLSNFIALNIGFNDLNFTIKELAEIVRSVIGNTIININYNASPDRRSYKVNFNYYKELAPECIKFKPVEVSVQEIAKLIVDSNFNENNFRSGHLIRLNALNYLINMNHVNQNLFWK